MSAPPSALHARHARLDRWLAVSFAGHVGAVFTMVVAQYASLWWSPSGPLIDPDDVIEVAMVALPKTEEALPTRATRQAAPKAPEPVPKPPEPAKVPPKQSDLVIKQPKADPKAAAVAEDSKREMDELMQELKMNDLLADLDADVGNVDRDAASPEGVEGAPPSRVVGAASGDPEVARYIATLSELFMSHFRPLPMLKGQGLVSKVLVKVDGNGKVTRREVETSSGNPSWDRAALTAVDQVDSVPLPPEKYRGSTYDYRIIFEER